MTLFPSLTRRRLLMGAAAVAWDYGCAATRGSRARADSRLTVGFLRQTDAASLLMADELGTYSKQGLLPKLYRGATPAELRDKLLSDELTVAHLPSSLPVAHAIQSGTPDLVTLMVLSHNGGAITLGRDSCAAVTFLDLGALRDVILRRPPIAPAVFAVPAIGGTDDLTLRYLLGASGVQRNRVQVVAAPLERMLADLREERIMGFAAPDPWSALAATQGLGFTFATAQDICTRAPRSALVTTRKNVVGRRSELKSLIRALIEAAVWLDVPSNRARFSLSESLARRESLDMDVGPIRARLGSVYDLGCRFGERDFENEMLFFHRAGRVNLPLRADAYLYHALLRRFGIASMKVAEAHTIDETIRDDLYREVAREMGIRVPEDMKPFVVTLDSVRFDATAPSEWPRLWATD